MESLRALLVTSDESIRVQQQPYVTGWEEKYNTLFVDGFAYATALYPSVVGNDIPEYFSFIDHVNRVEVYYSESSQDHIDAVHGQYFLDRGRSDTLLAAYNQMRHWHTQLLQKIQTLDDQTLRGDELLMLFDEFMTPFVRMLAYYRSTRHEAEIGPGETIKQILRQNYNLEDPQYLYGMLTESRRPTLIELEKRDWLVLLQQREVTRTDYLSHVNRYASFFVNYWDLDQIVETLKLRYRTDRGEVKRIQREVHEKQDFLDTLPAQQARVYAATGQPELKRLCQMLQAFGWYRFEMKDIWAGAEVRFLPLFQRIAAYIGTDVSALLNLYTIADLRTAIEQREPLAVDEVKRRRKGMAMLVAGGRYRLVTGQRALDYLEIPRQSFKKVDVVRGEIGYRGVVRGYVQKVYPDTMGNATFQQGNILVTTATQPSMVPIMTKAAAFVTDFGGITSHSAIVARELKTPCIIGTKNGSRVLEDGDYVEVNANEGYVTKLPDPKS